MKKLKLEKFICLFNGMKSDLIKSHENSIKLNDNVLPILLTCRSTLTMRDAKLSLDS